MLAVLKAGGAFVPLDPSHPAERLRHFCESVGANLALCSGHLSQMLAGVVDTVLPVDDNTITEPEHSTTNGDSLNMSAVSSTNAAYIIFTSGSTGKPKVSKHVDIKSNLTRG
jgi:non-ribosomal peptide synthetase component F